MSRLRAWLVSFAAATLIPGASSALGAPIEWNQSEHKSISPESSQLVVLSTEEYQQYSDVFNEAKSQGFTDSEASVRAADRAAPRRHGSSLGNQPNPQQATPWTIMSDQNDREGVDMPARQGVRGTGTNYRGGFGYAKYSGKHNFRSIPLVRDTIRFGTKIQRPQYLGPDYDGHVVGTAPNGVYVDQAVQLGANAQRYSYALQQNSPDGKIVGVITAFCRGRTMCPEEVNMYGAF